MIGPGKYDDACTAARIRTKASGLLLIVIDGADGDGFSCQTNDPALLARLPGLLEAVAAKMRADLQGPTH